MTAAQPLALGIDVGTQSARAGLFTATGDLVGRGEHPLQIWHPQPDHVEQSSGDIWRAVCAAVHQAMTAAGATAGSVVGVGFDATCSLVAVGAGGMPVAVNREQHDDRDVIVWMDHRAVDDAHEINETNHPVLAFVGGAISPEMQTPKLRWVKRELPRTWQRAERWFDLADFLSWRATGSDVRSLCTTVCKWTYLGHEARWDASYFAGIGLDDVLTEDAVAIGSHVRPPGEVVGGLSQGAARELGLSAGTAVATSLIDAHAGALGMIGARGHDSPAEGRLALIAGTSACHLVMPPSRVDVPGVWGPYWGALAPERWLLEAGISASGAFLDLLVTSHPAATELGPQAFATLDERLDRLAVDPAQVMGLTRDLHLQPHVLGNRAPLADPELRGGLVGWALRDDLDDLAAHYLAGVQALSYATRHIVEAMRGCGVSIDAIVACGGSAGDEWWLRAHADALGLSVALPEQPDAVLLGAAMLGATAAGVHASLDEAMAEMTRLARIVEPDPVMTAFHDAKYAVYRRMIDDQLDYRSMMRPHR